MARKSESPQKEATKEMMRGYLKDNNVCIKDRTNVNFVMQGMEEKILSMVHILSFG